MNDRLAELRSKAGNAPGPAAAAAGGADHADIDVDLEEGRRAGQPKFMQEFFQAVDAVKVDIGHIRAATKRIGEINQQAVLATTADKESECSRELQPLITSTNKKAQTAKGLLQKVRTDTEKLKEDGKVKASEMRIRENLQNTLTRKFVDVMKEYQNAQQKYKSDIKKKVKRQVQIVKPDATDQEIDTIMRSGGGAGEVYRTAILKGEAADPIKSAYANAVDKYQDVLTLEASVGELHQMFMDFALLIERQGELLDQIEFQVKSAADFIEDGNTDMVQAIELQKDIRKKQCILIAILMVVIIVVVGSVMGSKATKM